jgi:hypothetical protein
MRNKEEFLKFISNAVDAVHGEWDPQSKEIVLDTPNPTDQHRFASLLKDWRLPYDYQWQTGAWARFELRQGDYCFAVVFNPEGKFLRFEIFED